MLQMKRAVPADRDDIVRLWQAEFGDEEAFIDEFCAWCGWEQIFLLWEDGEARAMTAAPLMEVVTENGTQAKVGYVYAHTTRKEHRGRGFGKMLLNYADFCLQNQNADGVVLVPAEPSLFDYFARSLYGKGFALCEREGNETERPAGAVRPVSAEEYHRLREERLTGVCHTATPTAMLEQQKNLCRKWGGDLYAVELAEGCGCAVAEMQEDGTLYLRELLVPEGREDGAAALLRENLNAARAVYRCPARNGAEGIRPFGAVKWYRPGWAELWREWEASYFGPALD